MLQVKHAFIVVVLLMSSCDNQENGKAIARVYNSYLYQQDLQKAVPDGMNDVDSIKRADMFVNNWVREQVVLHKANLNLNVDDQFYEDRLASYKNELIIYDFQNELIKQKLNTSVTEEEAREYYNEFQDNFILRNHVMKIKYAIYEEGSEDLKQFGQWMRGSDNEENIKNFARDYALLSSVDADNWVRLEEISGIIPMDSNGMSSLVTTKGYKYFEKEGKEYFVRIVDSKLKGEIAPFELVRDKVESTVINKRKSNLLKKMREDLYKESISSGELEIFK